MKVALAELGWDRFFEQAFEALAESRLVPGRISLPRGWRCTVQTSDGEIKAAVPRSLPLRSDGRRPAVGDWVALRVPKTRTASVRYVLPRKTSFARQAPGKSLEQQVIACNIDTVFLVMGLDDDFNLRRLERFLVLTYESGASPVILLNKDDLCSQREERIAEVREVALGVDVYAVSALQGDGMEQLSQHLLPGRTIALLGSSGVGKSTLVNQLLGRPRQEVGAVRESDSKGRHTTSHRELIALPNGCWLIDTPGLREIQLWAGEESLQQTFHEIDDLAAGCRFNDCRHDSEPDCAVRDALQQGLLPAERWESYQKLKSELAYFESRRDEQASLKRKQEERRVHAQFRKMKHRP